MNSSVFGFDVHRNTSETDFSQSVSMDSPRDQHRDAARTEALSNIKLNGSVDGKNDHHSSIKHLDAFMQASHKMVSESYSSASTASMIPINRLAADAKTKSEMSPLRRIINGTVELIPIEMSEKTQASVVDRTAMLLKMGTLYYHTEGGRFAYIALSALDEPVKGRGTFSAMGFGALKGALTYGISKSVSGSMMSPVAKGAMISLSSQIIDIGLSNDTYKDYYGNFSLESGVERLTSTVLSPSNLMATTTVALVTQGAFYGINRYSSNMMKQSPFLNMVVNAGVMGGTTGSTMEYFRQRTNGEQFDIGKIAKAGAVEALFSGAAAIPGGIKADPILREKVSEALFYRNDPDRRPMLYYPEGQKEPRTIRIERNSPLNELYEKAQESVVKISTLTGSGSGFFVSKDGELVTNAHVVGDQGIVKVQTAQGYQYRAKVVEIDAVKDFAILKVMNPDRQFKPLAFETNATTGESIMVAGFARGGDQIKVSTGVIEGVERVPTVAKVPLPREHTPENYYLPHEFNKKFGVNPEIFNGQPFQVNGVSYKELWTTMLDATNTALPGHSGSPILNGNGNVVGVVSRGSVDDVAGVRPVYVMQGLEALHPNPVLTNRGSSLAEAMRKSTITQPWGANTSVPVTRPMKTAVPITR